MFVFTDTKVDEQDLVSVLFTLSLLDTHKINIFTYKYFYMNKLLVYVFLFTLWILDTHKINKFIFKYFYMKIHDHKINIFT